jgi:hypothetical protein
LFQQQKSFRSKQRFWREVDQPDFTTANSISNLEVLGMRNCVIKASSWDVELAQLSHLILHERDERRDYHGQAIEEQGGELVAEGLTSAGGHHHQAVVSRQHTTNHFRLEREEVRETEGAL